MEDFSNMISVLNLPGTVADVSVREQFSVCGPVHWTSIVAPGCALVRFATPDSAQKAISTFHGGTWAGQSLQVQPFTLQPALLTAMPKPNNDNQVVDLSHAVDSPSSFTLPAGHVAGSPMTGSPDMSDMAQCSPGWNNGVEDCQGMDPNVVHHPGLPEVVSSADTEVAYDSTLGVWRSPRRDGRSESWEANSPETWTSAPMPTPVPQKPVPRPSREDLNRMAAMSGYNSVQSVQGGSSQQWSPQPQSPNAAYQTPMMFEEPYSRTPSTQGYDPQPPRMSCDGQGARSKSDSDRLRLMKIQSNTPPGTPKSHEQSPAAMMPQHVAFSSQPEIVARINSNITPMAMYRGASNGFTPVSPMYGGHSRVSMPNTPTMRSMPSYSEYIKENDLANMLTSLQIHHQPPQRPSHGGEKPSPDVPAHLMSMLQNSRLAEAVANAPPGTDIMSLVASAEFGGNSPMSPTKSVSRVASDNWSQYSPNFQNAPNAGLPPILSGQVLQEFTNARGVLVQLMLNAYQLLGSENVAMFGDRLSRIGQLYDEMHELPVVQKRKKCAEMAVLKNHLMQDTWFVNTLQTLCTFRNHMYSLSRKVLFMNNGPEGVPIDLFLGSMSSDVYHLLKSNLAPEVCEYFTNSVPNPRLALLVFCEFTTVDPAPVAPITSIEALGTA